jgi:anti-sigma-K factor RskA
MKHLEFNNELQERALLYSIGALPEDERREYARHLEEDGCEICLAESREFQSVAQSFARSVPMETPSDAVKERVMAQVRVELGTRTSPAILEFPKRNIWYWAEKAVLVAAVVLLAITATTNSGLRREIGTLTARIGELEGEVGSARVMLAMLTSPRIVNLQGQGGTPQARGRIFWDEGRRVWLFSVAALPQVPQDRTYQLWFVPQTGNPVSAQVFNTGPDGSAVLEIPLPANATNFKVAAVTTEPAGGLPQPSGAFALLGGD